MPVTTAKAEGIILPDLQALIRLRLQADTALLGGTRIRARQGGQYLSGFRGRGMEFDESRIYQAGDDIRNMDWRVTARTGTAHTKVFREERERPVLLWLDLSHSMQFATRNKFKSVIATELAALLAWSAAKNGDRLGGLIFAESGHIELKPRRGKSAVLDFLGRCQRHRAWQSEPAQPSAETGDKAKDDSRFKDAAASTPQVDAKRHCAEATARLRKVAHTGSLIFMLSDFRHLGSKARTHIANIARHNSIVFIQISDPLERQLPSRGHYRLTDGLRELLLNADSRHLRREYAKRAQQRQQGLQRFCRQHGIRLLSLSTQTPALDKLRREMSRGAAPGAGHATPDLAQVRKDGRRKATSGNNPQAGGRQP